MKEDLAAKKVMKYADTDYDIHHELLLLTAEEAAKLLRAERAYCRRVVREELQHEPLPDYYPHEYPMDRILRRLKGRR
ncbi:MAG: hypothetical protein HC794_01805 [Nitrospiraceae bacterium]|nr:hypothetical protein [Nitrospiraceae bacterium]